MTVYKLEVQICQLALPSAQPRYSNAIIRDHQYIIPISSNSDKLGQDESPQEWFWYGTQKSDLEILVTWEENLIFHKTFPSSMLIRHHMWISRLAINQTQSFGTVHFRKTSFTNEFQCRTGSSWSHRLYAYHIHTIRHPKHMIKTWSTVSTWLNAHPA